MTAAASMYVTVWMHKKGSHTSTATLDWWYTTNRGYLAKLLKPSEKESLVETLHRMKALFETARGDGGLYVWNTGTFDVDVLNNAYKRLIDPNETHNAYEDCIRQIGYITDVTQYLAEQE